MSEIIPIFKTQGSFYKSLITTDKKEEISEEYSVTLSSIVKNYKLEKVLVIDDTFFAFPELYKNVNKLCEVIFGLDFVVCKDAKDKSEQSLKTESKISILMRNSGGYEDLLKIHNLIYTNQDYFYYRNRSDWGLIKNNITENLLLLLPPFDNFIHKNLLYDSICVPDFGKIKPIITYANMELPWGEVLNENIKNYALNNKYDLMKVHPISYYRNSDVKGFQNKRSVEERGVFSDPHLQYFCSDKFSFEEYCRKVKIEFIK
ncbi:MAG: hypothetical protein Q7R95_05975 [bacterium]|nr:hypothetical protein [bacterium]